MSEGTATSAHLGRYGDLDDAPSPHVLSAAVAEHICAALHELEQLNESTCVHAARRSLKRARALLRLSRGAVPKRSRRRLDAYLREAMRDLSEPRDREVQLQTCTRLLRSLRDDEARRGAETLRERLAPQPTSIRASARTATQKLRDAQQHLAFLTRCHPSDWPKGLRRTYRSGRARYRIALRRDASASFHAWRRQAKYLQYQLELAYPRTSFSLLDGLGHLLGRQHDLALLESNAKKVIGADADKLVRIVRRQRRRLQRKALKIGAELYSPSPKRFAALLEDNHVHPMNRAIRFDRPSGSVVRA